MCIFRVVVLVCMSCLCATSSFARDAEDERLSRELTSLAQRNAWDGVTDLLAQIKEPNAADLLAGAQAARRRGDLAQVRAYLESAVGAGDTEDAAQWLQQLYTETRPVALDGGRELRRTPPPFNPDHIAAIAHANRQLSADEHFVGLLPHGAYRLDTHTFDVTPGNKVLKISAPAPIAPAAPPAVADVPKPPTAHKRSVARPVLLAVAGSLAATSVGLYATGAQRRGLWSSASDVRDVRALRSQTNRYSTLSGVTAGAALGVGVAGFAFR